MRKRRYFLVPIAVAVVIGGVVVVCPRSREPTCGGRTLSQWVKQYYSDGSPESRREAADAFRRMGSNAVPYFLKWMQYEPAPWKANLPDWLNPVWPSYGREAQRADFSAFAFRFLGSNGQAAIPELTRMLADQSANPRRAVDALASLGDIGLPPLLAVVTNRPNRPGNFMEMYALYRLSRLGTNARPAVPAVLSLVTDVDPAIRAATTNALRRIDPAALERNEAGLEKMREAGREATGAENR